MTPDQFFEQYKNSEKVSYVENVSKVFNISGINTPLKTYNLSFDYNGGNFKIYYEVFHNPPPGLAAYGGRQLCFVKCVFPTEARMVNFYIEKRGLITRIFKPNSTKNFIVKTKDKNLLSILWSDQHLALIYKISEQSSLSPSISGKPLPHNFNKYEISISFGASVFESKVLSCAIDFCKKMIESNH